MITINNPEARIRGISEPEIIADMGVDFHLPTGARINVRLETDGTVTIHKVSLTSDEIIYITPVAQNCFIVK